MSWNEVVQQAKANTAAAPVQPPRVQQLVRQAEELKGLLDELADRMNNNNDVPAPA